MDLLQLEHFLAVVEERTFTRAAERVCRTQPAVSQSIKKLEEEIGSALFAREVHDVTLTEAGKVLVDHARRIVKARNDALRDVTSLRDLTDGTLMIAADEAAAVYLMANAVPEYVRRFPHIKISIVPTLSADVQRYLLDRDVHVGFIAEQAALKDLQSVEVVRDELVVVTSPRRPLAARLGVRLADLGAESFIAHHSARVEADKVTALFRDEAVRCHVVAEVWSFEQVKALVAACVGIAIVPSITVQRELKDGTLVRLHVPELNIQTRTFMVHRPPRYLSEAAREFAMTVQPLNLTRRPLGSRAPGVEPVASVPRPRAAVS